MARSRPVHAKNGRDPLISPDFTDFTIRGPNPGLGESKKKKKETAEKPQFGDSRETGKSDE